MRNEIKINLVNILVLFIFLSVSLIYTGVFNVLNCSVFLASVSLITLLGYLILIHVKAFTSFTSINQAFSAFFIGSLFSSFYVFLNISNPVFFILVLLIICALLIFAFKIKFAFQFNFDKYGIFIFLIAVVLFIAISGIDISKQFLAFQSGSFAYPTDTYYFTSIVASLRHGSINNAVYEVNSPLVYQLLGFFPPALLANLLNISSHQALWGMMGPFYKILAIMLGNELCYSFFKDKISRNSYWFALASITFPILLAPLHPLYLIKFQVTKFIFNGIAYLIPNGIITYPFTMVLLLLSIILFFNIDWKIKKINADKILFILLSSFMIISKLPLYLGFLFFLFAVILYRLLKNKESIFSYLLYFITLFILSYVFLRVIVGNAADGALVIRYGYLLIQFGEWYHRNTHGIKNELILYGLIIATYLLWMGIRLWGLANLMKPYTAIFLGTVFTIIASTILALFMRIEIRNEQTNAITDASFNVEQFIRASFYIATLFSCIGILEFFVRNNSKLVLKKTGAAAVALWCSFTFISLAAQGGWSLQYKPNPWYVENYNLLKSGKLDDGLIVVNPHAKYYGLMLSCSDHGTYWSAMDRSEGNYNASKANSYRWKAYADLLTNPTRDILEKMKSEHVKYIIAIPDDIDQIKSVAAMFPDLLQKVDGTNWVYEIK